MTDFRELCAELLDEMDYYTDWSDAKEVKDRARAALAESELDPPTDEDLLRTYGLAKRNHCYEGPIDDWSRRAERAATVAGLRAILACWGSC